MQSPEGTYRACKLDPGVDRLRPGVPHGVHQPDHRPAGPGQRSLPAGVGLQRAGSGQAGVRGRTQQVSMSWRVGAGLVSRAGVGAKGGLSANGAWGCRSRRRAGGGAAVGAGPSREGVDAALARARPPSVRKGSPGRRATAPPQPPPPDMPPLRTPARGHSLSAAPSQRPPLWGHCLEPCAPSCPQWSSHLRGGGRGDPEAGTELWLSLSVQGAPGRASAQTLLSWVFSSVPTPPAGPPPTAQSSPAAPQVADQTVWLDSDLSLAAPSLTP